MKALINNWYWRFNVWITRLAMWDYKRAKKYPQEGQDD